MVKRRINNSAIICFIILVIIPLIFGLHNLFSKNVYIAFEFWTIGIISVYTIFAEYNSRRSYSIAMFGSFFIYIFFFIAAGYQYLNNHFMYNIVAEDYEIIYANICILIWQTVYLIITKVKKKKGSLNIFDYKSNLYISSTSKELLIILCFAIGILYVAQNGIQVLFNRYAYNENFSTSSQSLTSIMKILKSGLGMWTLYICAIDYKQNNAPFVYVLFSLLACFILNPPFASSRTIVLVTYCGFLLIVSNRLKRGMNFFLLIIVLDLFAAPLFNLFRGGLSGDNSLFVSAVRDFKENFLVSDYDAYSVFLLAIKYVSVNGVTFGVQLLSVILFFVPRSIWTTKAVGSGATIMSSLKTANVSNISCPILGEAYINFGFCGIIIFAILISWFFNKVDLAYWNSDLHIYSPIKNIYSFLCLFVLLIFRGDLLNAYSWLFGYVVDLIIIKMFFLRRITNEDSSDS